MQPANPPRLRCGHSAILAAVCLMVPLVAKEVPNPVVTAQRALDQRRIDLEEAKELLEQGDIAYEAGRYGDALTAFSGARELIPDAPITKDFRNGTTERLILAAAEHARHLSRKGDVAGAKAVVDKALSPEVAPNDPRLLTLRNQLDDPTRTNPALTKQHAADIDTVRQNLYAADGAFNLGKFDEATTLYRKVLQTDPTNTAARRGMERVTKAKSEYHRTAADHTRSEMLAQVGAAWELKISEPILEPTGATPGLTDTFPGGVPIANKLDRIIIPNLILEDASLEDAIDLLRLRATELDTLETDPARRGINFNVEIGGDDSPLAREIRAARFDLRLSQVPISKILEYINAQTKTTYATDEFAVVIRPRGVEAKGLTSRSFRVPPNFLSALGNADAGANNADPFAAEPARGLLTERRGVVEMLKEQGIQFPEGATATLSGGNLIATNTAANLDIIGEIVNNIAKTEPVLVKVTFTMISAEQTRLKELGFDWLLGNIGFGGAGWIPGTDTLNLGGGTQGTGGNLGDMGLPPGQQTSNPVTAGNRSGAEAIYQDSIDALIDATNRGARFNTFTPRGAGPFQVTKLFDNSSAQALIRALSQKKGVDIMTAASTVTRNGQQSTVKSVKEMPYPQGYEPPELPNSIGQDDNFGFLPDGSLVGGGGRAPFAITPSHPTDFTTREIGVILEVTPTADLDSRTVELALLPSVVDFDGFVNYGSPINEPTTQSGIGLFNPLAARAVEISPNRILEPVFSVHRTATSINVIDGTTIAIGGLIQDRIQNVDDRTPILGEIPVVGRLFQSKVDQKISTAVVFLVHVEMLDPTGQPFSKR